jgi:hypothetical protein
MSYFTHDFITEITTLGVGKSRVVTYKVLFLPPYLEHELPFKEYPRLRVEGEIADVPVRGAWIPVGDGRRYFIVSPHIKANTGLDVGDEVEMRFKIDDQDYVDVPQTLQLALESDVSLQALWNDLTSGKRRMYSHHMSSAKTPPTEQRRLEEIVTSIKEGVSLRDLLSSRRKNKQASK